jgi:NIMA (never in mitosis gene a)-related kinase
MKEFKTLRPLGKGSFGQVFLVERISDKECYAMKRMNMHKVHKETVAAALNEVRLLASLRHPNIVGFLDAFLHKSHITHTPELCVVMEFCERGDLFSIIESQRKKQEHIVEEVVWDYATQLALALQQLHAVGIIHRDIKPANCFVSKKGVLKLGDMNVSKHMKAVGNGGKKGNMTRSHVGTPYTMAPEVICETAYNSQADMWAFGCVVHELMSLRPPFNGYDMEGLKHRCAHSDIHIHSLSLPLSPSLSPPLSLPLSPSLTLSTLPPLSSQDQTRELR